MVAVAKPVTAELEALGPWRADPESLMVLPGAFISFPPLPGLPDTGQEF